jgi:hypothetical protein
MYSCDEGAEQACDRVDRSLADARRMVRHSQIYEHGLRGELRNSIDAAGTRGDENGTLVTMGVRSGCSNACAFVGRQSERRIVVFNPQFVVHASHARFTGAAIHEFGHVYDFSRWGNNNPRTFQERYDTERRYTPLGVVVRGILGERPYGADAGLSPEEIGRRHGYNAACNAYRVHSRRQRELPGPCPVNAW